MTCGSKSVKCWRNIINEQEEAGNRAEAVVGILLGGVNSGAAYALQHLRENKGKLAGKRADDRARTQLT